MAKAWICVYFFLLCSVTLAILTVTGVNAKYLKSGKDDPYIRVVTTGLTSILWDESPDFGKQVSSLSPSCASALNYIYNGVRTGSSKAYELLDYSSRVPSGILEGTTVALGDYDACLSLQLDQGHGVSQYCSVTLALTDPRNTSAVGQLYYNNLPYMDAYDLTFGLCLPSACSIDDVGKFVSIRTKDYPLQPAQYKPFPLDFDNPIYCDTLERNSWYYRLTNLSWYQITSIILINILPAFVVFGTLADLIGMNNRLSSFSAFKTLYDFISYEEPSDVPAFIMNTMKVRKRDFDLSIFFLFLY